MKHPCICPASVAPAFRLPPPPPASCCCAEEETHQEEKRRQAGWRRAAVALGRPFAKQSAKPCRLHLQASALRALRASHIILLGCLLLTLCVACLHPLHARAQTAVGVAPLNASGLRLHAVCVLCCAAPQVLYHPLTEAEAQAVAYSRQYGMQAALSALQVGLLLRSGPGVAQQLAWHRRPPGAAGDPAGVGLLGMARSLQQEAPAVL